MARTPSVTKAAAAAPEPSRPHRLVDVDEAAVARIFADLIDADADNVELEDLVGTPAFLDVLDALPPTLRAKHGFTFAVYDATRGPLAYMPDSDWGSTVPTEAAIAERYGPGLYRVRPSCRRRKRGGGNQQEITVRIAPSREPGGASAPSSAHDREFTNRLFDLLEHRTEGELEATRDLAATETEIPSEAPAWLTRVMAAVASKQSGDLPEWLQPIVGKFADKLLDDETPGKGS